jgi:hypothetical protein
MINIEHSASHSHLSGQEIQPGGCISVGGFEEQAEMEKIQSKICCSWQDSENSLGRS